MPTKAWQNAMQPQTDILKIILSDSGVGYVAWTWISTLPNHP